MHVQYPHWYNLVSYNIMEHTAHHIDPRIPLYNLSKAQAAVTKLLGDDIVTIKFSLTAFIKTLSLCKLYDYEENCWTDFDGKPVENFVVAGQKIELAKVA